MAVLGTLAATGQLPGLGARHDLTVSLSLFDPPEYYSYYPDSPGLDDSCITRGGYSDIGTGTSFQVRDENGETIGTGVFGDGTYEGYYSCTWTATVSDLPKAESYTIDSGRRGSRTYTYDELVSSGWDVGLSLGS